MAKRKGTRQDDIEHRIDALHHDLLRLQEAEDELHWKEEADAAEKIKRALSRVRLPAGRWLVINTDDGLEVNVQGRPAKTVRKPRPGRKAPVLRLLPGVGE